MSGDATGGGRRAWMAAGLLAAGAGAALSWWRLGPQPAAAGQERLAVDQLFALTLPDPDGAPVALAQWRQRRLVVNFWASWCAPCVDEMPELSALAAELEPAGTRFVGLAIDNAANVQRFAEKLKVRYPLLVLGAAGTGLMASLGNPQGGLPFTVVIDANGAVPERILGRVRIQSLRKVLT